MLIATIVMRQVIIENLSIPLTLSFILLQISPPTNIPPAAPGTAAAPTKKAKLKLYVYFGNYFKVWNVRKVNKGVNGLYKVYKQSIKNAEEMTEPENVHSVKNKLCKCNHQYIGVNKCI